MHGFFVAHMPDQRLLQQLDEILLGQAHQQTVGGHRHGGVALGVRHQRFLAEAVAAGQLGQLFLPAICRCAGDDTAALVNGIEEVTVVTLAYDHVALVRRIGLHLYQQALDHRRWNLDKGLGLEHLGHPVLVVLGVDFSCLGAGGLVPGQENVKQPGIDPGNDNPGDRAGGQGAGLLVCNRVATDVRTGLDFSSHLAVTVDEVDLAVEQVDGLVVAITLAEQVATFLDFLDDDLLGDLCKA